MMSRLLTTRLGAYTTQPTVRYTCTQRIINTSSRENVVFASVKRNLKEHINLKCNMKTICKKKIKYLLAS